MAQITMNLHFCNKNWGADNQVMIDTINSLFDTVTVSQREDGNISHAAVTAFKETSGDATLINDSVDGELFQLLNDLLTQYVPYSLTVVAVNDDRVDVTYLLDSTKTMMAVNGSGDHLYDCSTRPVPVGQ